MKARLARAILFVKHVQPMVDFYCGMLGLEEVVTGESGDSWRVLGAGGMELALHAIPAQYAAGIEIGDPPVAREEGITKLVFQVDDVAAARQSLLEKGAIEVNGQFLQEPLVYCHFIDPEGNVFQLSQT